MTAGGAAENYTKLLEAKPAACVGHDHRLPDRQAPQGALFPHESRVVTFMPLS